MQFSIHKSWPLRTAALLAVCAAAPAIAVAASGDAPGHSATMPAKGPVGWDIYRNLDALPHVPQGVTTQQTSSADPQGSNHDFDHTLGKTADGHYLLAKHDGPGEIDAIWTTSKGGDVTQTGHIKVVLDGKTVIDAPEQDVVDGKLGAPFVFPLVANARQTSGGVYIEVPMTFRHSMRVTTTHDPDYYHVLYRSFANAHGVQTFSADDKAADVIARMKAAGAHDPKPHASAQSSTSKTFSVQPGKSAVLAQVAGPGRINALVLDMPQLVAADSGSKKGVTASDDILQHARVRISFDGHRTVDAPLGQFFGSGLGVYPVKALMMAMNPRAHTLSSWWPMPYRHSARITLYNGSRHAISKARTQVTSQSRKAELQALGPGGHDGYFHATFNRQRTRVNRDYLFLRASGQGKFVGVSETMRGLVAKGSLRGYLEGDAHISVDGAKKPQIDGTGTEDFYQGGWYFNKGPFTDPLNGNPAHQQSVQTCRHDCTGAYRLMLGGVPFSISISAGIEHGGVDEVPTLYSSTTFWYARPGATQHTGGLHSGHDDSNS